MINRTLVRTKVIQTLFAYYKDGEQTPLSAKKALLKSFSNTYSLYMLLLDLVNEMTRLAEEKIEQESSRAQILHEDYQAEPNLVNNKFAQQVFNNRQLRGYMNENHLSWDVAHESVSRLFKQIINAEFVQAYLSQESPTYEDDKHVWRRIFVDILADNEELESALEELEVALDGSNWSVDANVVISYIVKTIKRFEWESKQDQPLLEMFDSESELSFAKELLQKTIDGEECYRSMIERHLKNWDMNRVAYMDLILLQTALAEIMEFPSIALQVSMNEYLELAKEYSTEKSYAFINGILEEVVKELKKENKLVKAVTL